MQDPYRMVLVSAISFFTLICVLLTYRFVFPKRKINLFFILILASILPTISIFRIGAYESGDFNIHIYRIMAFYKSLSEGIIMPSWAAELNATYGYPLFIFNYSLPYYLVSFFHFLGFSFIASMKIFLASSYILSGIFMYFFTKNLFKNTLAAFTASIFYLFTPYHLIDLHFKVAVGELLTFTLIPLIFLFIHKLYVEKKIIFLISGSFFLALLFMSNALIAFFVVALVLTYSLFLATKQPYNVKYLLQSLLLIFLSLILSIYVWAPPLIFSSVLFTKNLPLIIGYFPTIPDLLYSPWRMGFLFQGHYGEISNLIGYSQVFIIIAIFFSFISKRIPKNQKKDIFFWLLIIIFTIFLITSSSRSIWEHLSFVKAAGSHRLLLILTFCISVIAGYFVIMFKKKTILIWVLIVITISYTMLNWGHRRMIPEISDATLTKQLWKSTSESEGHYYANTKWVNVKNPWFSKLPNNRLEIITGIGQIKNLLRTSTLHKYTIIAKSPLKVRENTLYFPGWEAKLNGKILPIYPDSNGTISFNIPTGSYNLELIYNDSFPYRITKLVNLIGFIITLGSIIFLLLNKPHAKK